ncbi:MAG: hypothetical protein V3U60_08710, partial [Gammaproteobacteria bacterium]
SRSSNLSGKDYDLTAGCVAFLAAVSLGLSTRITANTLLHMNILRHKRLRRLIAALFLLTGLVSQTQTLFACDLMDGKTQTVCCCGDEHLDGCTMGGSCTTHNGSSSGGCCDVAFENMPNVAAASPVSLDSPFNLFKASQSTSVVLPDTIARIAAVAGRARFSAAASSFNFGGTQTYLLTSRLRL